MRGDQKQQGIKLIKKHMCAARLVTFLEAAIVLPDRQCQDHHDPLLIAGPKVKNTPSPPPGHALHCTQERSPPCT